MRYTADTPDHEALLRKIISMTQSIEMGEEAEAASDAIEVIYTGRNRLYRIRLSEGTYVVKSFAHPNLLNAIYYGLIGATKAQRSHSHALELVALGLLPEGSSLGYAEERDRLGLLGRSYHVSAAIDATEYSIHPHMRGWMAPEGFMEHLAAFIAQVHSCGVMHMDLSPGNVLYRYDMLRRQYTFYLVDLNRMRLLDRPLTPREVADNVSRLSSCPSVTSQLAALYASTRQWDVETTVRAWAEQTDRFWLGRLPKLSFRWQARQRGMSIGTFVGLYMGYLSMRWVRHHIGLPKAWVAWLYGYERAIYYRYLCQEDIRHALRRREGY